MANNIEQIKKLLKDDRIRLAIKNLLIDWQNAKDDLPALKKAIDKKFSSEEAAVFNAIDVQKLSTIILQMDLLSRGNVKEVKWVIEKDDDVCLTCQQNDGKTFPVATMDTLLPAHDGCRCTLKPTLSVSIAEDKLREILDKK